MRLLSTSLFFAAAAARPNGPWPASTVLAPATTPSPAAAATAASMPGAPALTTKTIVSSDTQTSVTHPQWIGPTVVTIVASITATTLIPEQPAQRVVPGGGGDDDDGAVVETVYGATTFEYRMTFSDGHSSTSWHTATHEYTTTVG